MRSTNASPMVTRSWSVRTSRKQSPDNRSAGLPNIAQGAAPLAARPLARTLGVSGWRGVEYDGRTYLTGWRMNYTIEAELEDDGRWLAEVPQLPGVLAFGTTGEAESRLRSENEPIDASGKEQRHRAVRWSTSSMPTPPDTCRHRH
jgi:hypothetical protein